jgi:hypothetical protein
MAVFLWSNYWQTPGDSFTDPPPQNLKVDSVTTSSVVTSSVNLTGPLLYNGHAWLSYTPTLALINLPPGYSGTITSNTISGRYRRIDSLVFFNISGGIVFNASAGGDLTISLPLAPARPFSATGSIPFTYYDSGTSTNYPAHYLLGAQVPAGATSMQMYVANGIYNASLVGMNLDLTNIIMQGTYETSAV